MKVLLCVLLLAAPAAAQTTTAWPDTTRPIANSLSNLDVAAIIGVDVVRAVRDPARPRWVSLACEGSKLAIANAVALAVKHYVPELRPDGSDRASFPSQHTANAFAMTGGRWEIMLPVAFSTAYLRTAANKHWWRDVGAGAAIGLWSRWFVGRLDVCQ